MFPKREGSSSPGMKDPPRGKRGRIQEKQSKYDVSVLSPCSRNRSQPVVGERPKPPSPKPDPTPAEDSDSGSGGLHIECARVVQRPVTASKKKEAPPPPTTKRVTLIPSNARKKNEYCTSNRCMDASAGQLCSCNRRTNNETVFVPQSRRCREISYDNRQSEQIIRMDPPPRQEEYEPRPTLPNPPPRFFRPNAIPQLQRYYWDIGDTTDLEFKFSEHCRTVSSTDVGGFKVWRYWCQTFSMECTIGDIVIFIEHNIEIPYPEYRLVSRCRGKKEELLPTDWYKTLRCLLLYPKATILILPRQVNYAWLKLLISRILLILLFPILFLMLVIKCSIAHLIHTWNSMYPYQR